jgi:hypothetical protein
MEALDKLSIERLEARLEMEVMGLDSTAELCW